MPRALLDDAGIEIDVGVQLALDEVAVLEREACLAPSPRQTEIGRPARQASRMMVARGSKVLVHAVARSPSGGPEFLSLGWLHRLAHVARLASPISASILSTASFAPPCAGPTEPQCRPPRRRKEGWPRWNRPTDTVEVDAFCSWSALRDEETDQAPWPPRDSTAAVRSAPRTSCAGSACRIRGCCAGSGSTNRSSSGTQRRRWSASWRSGARRRALRCTRIVDYRGRLTRGRRPPARPTAAISMAQSDGAS